MELMNDRYYHTKCKCRLLRKCFYFSFYKKNLNEINMGHRNKKRFYSEKLLVLSSFENFDLP